MAEDSPAAFVDRYTELNLAAHRARFEAAGWFTFGDMAYAAPQGANDEEFTQKVIVKGLGSEDHNDENSNRELGSICLNPFLL